MPDTSRFCNVCGQDIKNSSGINDSVVNIKNDQEINNLSLKIKRVLHDIKDKTIEFDSNLQKQLKTLRYKKQNKENEIAFEYFQKAN